MQTIAINTTAELAALVPRLMAMPLLAVDTEFVRVDTFNPRLGLIQIGDRDCEYLVDPLAVSDLSPLAPLLLAEYPRKILHACSEDLEVLARVAGGMPKGILDTQIAAAFLGKGLQLGYQKSLQDFLQVDIPKDESRSDWLARPLSAAQINYAALDVRFLPRLYDVIAAGLKERGLEAWFEADCALMLTEVNQLPDPEVVYQDVTNAWRLRRQELAVLKVLTTWREREARRRDVPRGFLIKNGSLFGLARRQPQALSALAEIEEMTPRIVRREGELLLQLIAEAKAVPEADWPAALPPPLPREAKVLFDKLKAEAEAVSAQHGVPAEVLLRKRHVEAMVLLAVDHGLEAEWPPALRGWRGEILTPRLVEVLRQHAEDLQAWREMRHRTLED
jgi:ribonuclease D